MSPRKSLLNGISLDQLSPEPRHIELVRQELANLDKKRTMLVGILNVLENAAGVAKTEVVIHPPRQKHESKEPTKALVLIEGTLPAEIYKFLTDIGRLATWDELRDALNSGPLAQKIANENSHYAGFQRLKERGYVVTYKGRIGTRENLKKFLDDVATGRAIDIVMTRYRNKYSEAIETYLNGRPEGATFREILNHLATIPEIGQKAFAGSGSYTNSQLSRMCRKNGEKDPTVVKIAKGLYQLKRFEEIRAPEAPASEARH